jgi:hypothetical protein
MLNMDTYIPRPSTFHFKNAWLRNNLLPSILPAWDNADGCADAAGQLAICPKAVRATCHGLGSAYKDATSTHSKLQIFNSVI